SDTSFAEPRACPLAILEDRDREMRDVVLAIARHEAARIAGERPRVRVHNLAAPRVPAVEPAEACAENRRLQLVAPRVPGAGQGVAVLLVPAVLAQKTHAVRDLVVVRANGAAVAERRQVLRRVEAERRDVAERAGTRAVSPRAHRLGAILHDRDSA